MAAPHPVVLVIEDEAPMRRFLGTTLRASGFQVVEAGTAREGMIQASGRNPDIILLDLGLPDAEGITIARELRKSAHTPIIVLSARDSEQAKVRALDEGADDYLTKPFGTEELLARIRVALRHAALPADAPPRPVFEAGALRVDLIRRRVLVGEREVHLTPTEYKLLAALIRHAGRVITHRQLLHEVWGAGFVEQTHYLRVYMAQLRHKLEADPTRPRLLTTEPGIGYRLRDDELPDPASSR